jgi:dephospho-CoA kinase
MTQKVGITGGIGSGKTTVCNLLEVFGYPVYYADLRANWLMTNDLELIQQISSAFGPEAYLNQEVNKVFFADLIFRNPEKKEQLNGLVHPVVRADFNKWVSRQSASIVFQESALLFETGSYLAMDFSVLVCAPETVKVERIMQRSGLTEQQVLLRMKNQLTDEQKIPLADFIIQNVPGQPLIPQVIKLLSIIRTN